MTASLSGVYNLQAFTSAGDLGVGMRLYFYSYGTTTKKDVYTDQAGTIAHTLTSDGAGGEYLALDARGEAPAPIYLKSGSYSVTLKTSDGATVWTRRADPIEGATTSYLPAGTGAVATTTQAKLRESVSVFDFMTAAEVAGCVAGTVNVTAAINAAITYIKTLTYGGEVVFPIGVYAVTEINASSATADFAKSVKLRGAGRLGTSIVPFASGNVLLNMMGSNNMQVQGMTFASSAYASQAAIFMARSTTSTNCNNNRFTDVFTEGSYTVASVVCNGSESTNWINCRFENSNASANYCTFRSGGQTGVQVLQGITTVNGGTILDSSNPNTDNKMFGVEFYSPYTSAYIIKFDYSAGYACFGCTVIGGTADTVRMVSYQAYAAGSNTFLGAISWFGCMFEVFGSGNTIHWLNGNGAAVSYFNGINSYGGLLQCGTSNAIGVIDYDRTNYLEQPTLRGSVWTTPIVSAGAVAKYNLYAYALFSCSISFKPNEGDGSLYLPGYANASSEIDVNYYYGGTTRFVLSKHESFATAIPTTGTYTVGETIWRETPAVGQPLGWRCTASGTLGTLNGGATTGSISGSSNVLTVSTATGLSVGQRINVAGATGNPFYIRSLVGTTAYLDALNTGGAVVAGAVSFQACTLVPLDYLGIVGVTSNAAGTLTVGTSTKYLINTTASTLTLPAAASFTGRELTISTTGANAIISAASDVVPITGGAAGTAILAATAGKWATLVSNGTSWYITAAN